MNILIVESAAKGRTLQRYLGDDWRVLATGGHVQTLPNNRSAHGTDGSKTFWANRSGELPSPPWVWTERGETAVRKIVEAAGDADDVTFWIATDPDREGEFIAWCLDRALAERGATSRVVFHEVTREALEEALEYPRGVDGRMVDSALVRKFLDRLVGFRTSKLAGSMVPGKAASMGRVQTPTLGFVVERELEREAHEPIPYFEVRALAAGIELAVRFHEPADDDAWRDEAGRAHPARTFDGDAAAAAARALVDAGQVTLTGARPSTRRRRPDAAFTTDALLQAAGSGFGWSPRKTSALASMLYEAGHITYIRTDSTRLAASAVARARKVVAETFGEDHLGDGARAPVAAGRTQDAHEAIRPTRPDAADIDLDDDDARRLYRLVRARTLASLMAPSERQVVSLEAGCDGLDRPLAASVSWRTFDGWEAAYGEFLGDVATAPPGAPLEAGAVWTLDPATEERDNPLLVEDQTRPPPRYRPHTLIKAMKDAGIGRPSTYSRTVEILEERDYVTLEDGALAPTERGRIVWTDVAPLYAEDGGDTTDADGDGVVELFSPEFTAVMEERLDGIERGELPAPATWEEWRDQFRDLHEAARARMKAGAMAPNQRTRLQRFLANAPEDARARHEPGLDDLSYADAAALIARLREQGVHPAPTRGQLDHLARLVEDLGLGPEDLIPIGGVRAPDEVRTTEQASALIDELRRLHDERQPASAKQRRFIEDLIQKAGTTEADASALVGLESLDQLTGGPEGSASALIDRLQETVPS
jgi:DNA topoisomerase I